jgi:hypothetical protein
MNKYIKYIIFISLILLIPFASKKIAVKEIDKRFVCMNHCNLHGLQCYGYIEKSIYDGNDEKSKLLNQEEYMVCFEPKEEIDALL